MNKNNNIIDLSLYETKTYSQYGEDGILEKLISLIYENSNNKFYVEFGVENGNQCNTRILREKYNWKGLLMDNCNENKNFNLKKEKITKENIIELFNKYHCQFYMNVLSIDIDFNDFYILHKILKNYIFDIIICEYNSIHNYDEDKIVIYNDNGWDGTNYYGASLLALKKLLNKFDYSLIYCTKEGVNCFFINNSIINKHNLNFLNIDNIKNIYKPCRHGSAPNWGHPEDSFKRKYICFKEAIKN